MYNDDSDNARRRKRTMGIILVLAAMAALLFWLWRTLNRARPRSPL